MHKKTELFDDGGSSLYNDDMSEVGRCRIVTKLSTVSRVSTNIFLKDFPFFFVRHAKDTK